MPTTYILHGGKTSIDLPGNPFFFRSFTEHVHKNEVSIVLCYWARQHHEWNTLFERDTMKVKQNTNKKVWFSIAESVEDLYQKLSLADVLFVSGGDAPLIEDYLPKLSDLKQKLNGKVYLGSSMGAFVASRNYVLSFDEHDQRNVHQGLGLVPIQILCHWNAEQNKERKIKLLQETSTDPIVTLHEGESITIVY